MSEQQIWYKDPSSFIDSKRMLEFWPSPTMELNTRVNATTRFILYACFILTLMTKKLKYIVLGILLIMMLAYVHKTHDRFTEDEVISYDQPQGLDVFQVGADLDQVLPSQPYMEKDFIKFAKFLSKKE